MAWYARFCNWLAWIICAAIVVWTIERILFVLIVLWPFV